MVRSLIVSKTAGMCLIVSATIMITFFVFKTLVVFKYIHHSTFTHYFEWLSVIAFMPPFFYVIKDFLKITKQKEEDINIQLDAIDTANLVVKLDISGKVISVNKNFCNSTGYLESELIGQHHGKLVSKKYKNSKEYIEFWDHLKSGKNVSGEFERVGKNGKSVWLFGNYTPIKNKEGVYDTVLKIATDVTKQHEVEMKVLQKSVYLEHASKIIRHDMHSGINTYIPRGITSLKRRLTEEQILSLKIGSPLKLIEDGLSHARKVYAGVYEFTNLVKQNAQMSKSNCNVKNILSEYLKLTAYSNQVHLDDNLPESIELNEPLFCTAVDNLIRNGLKYNDSPTKWVKIYFETDQQHNNSIIIEDNGRGITDEEFIELSKPYVRKEGQKEGGTGLGLNICIEILKEHKFRVEAEKTNTGTKIKISI